LGDKIKENGWARHVARTEERRGTNMVLIRRREGKSSLRRPRCRWKYNIKIYHKEVGWGN
jgi:hypothetical protein